MPELLAHSLPSVPRGGCGLRGTDRTSPRNQETREDQCDTQSTRSVGDCPPDAPVVTQGSGVLQSFNFGNRRIALTLVRFRSTAARLRPEATCQRRRVRLVSLASEAARPLAAAKDHSDAINPTPATTISEAPRKATPCRPLQARCAVKDGDEAAGSSGPRRPRRSARRPSDRTGMSSARQRRLSRHRASVRIRRARDSGPASIVVPTSALPCPRMPTRAKCCRRRSANRHR